MYTFNVRRYIYVCLHSLQGILLPSCGILFVVEFHMNGQWGRSVPHHPKLNQQKISEAISNISTNLASGNLGKQ